jgi:hypothetical protein
VFSIGVKVENKVLKVVTVNLIECNLVLNNPPSQELLKSSFVKRPPLAVNSSLFFWSSVYYTNKRIRTLF